MPAPSTVKHAALNKRRVNRWAAIAVAAVGAVLVALAVIDPGIAATDPQLHDGSVYVTNTSAEQVGKFNRQIDELAGSAALGRQGDVVQDGNDVLTVDRDTLQLTPLDAATLGLGSAAQLPSGADVALRHGMVAVSDPVTGALWVRPFSQVAGLILAQQSPDADLGPGGRSTVGPNGTVYGLSVERSELVTLTRGPEGLVVETFPIEGLDLSGDLQLTVVDETAVVMARDTGAFWIADRGVVEVPDLAAAQLQAPSARSPRIAGDKLAVVYATPDGLFGVGEKGPVLLGEALGEPAQPVVVEGCAHGAFSGVGTTVVLTRCDRSDATTAEATGWTPGHAVVFRVNRDEVVLNDVVEGTIWLVTENMRLVEGWDRITPPEEGKGEESEDEERSEVVNPNRDSANRAPVARPDQVTVRAGRATVLPLLDNDSDPDGDVLTFAEPPELSQGTLGRVRGGTGLQLTVDDNAAGQSFSFTYTIEDGRGGTASARVQVRVVSADQQEDNSAPVPVEHPRTWTVRSGGDLTARILLDWRDPEGDDLVLVSASVGGDDEVSTTGDGQLTFRDNGTETGRKEITVVVSDGESETTGTVLVQTVDSAVPPMAFGDFVTTQVGEQITINPLLNDVGDDLVLARIDQAPPNTSVALISRDSFTFTATVAGTYYLSYVVSNGPRSFGLIRIDVHDAPDENRPPVAARDTAQLPIGGSVLVDALANDEDPDGDVLAIQSVSTSPDLEVRILHRSQLLIIAKRTPQRPIVLTYQVSDGHHSVPGTVIVLPTALTKDAPHAEADSLTVRAGDIGAVRVLENDSSPSGQSLRITDLTEEPSAGEAWTSGELLRYRAPDRPGEYRAVYEITDEQGRTASASVRIFVIDKDVANTAPRPRDVEDRVLAGTTSRVVVNLRGIDPEGDSVRLDGIDSPPQLGRLVWIGDGQLGYEAYPDAAGTDTFTYRVVDAQGAEAIGTIRIAVVPRGVGNGAPIAVDDIVSARPGQTLRIDVLANDSDPDGDSFGFASNDLHGLPGAEIVDGRYVELNVGNETGTLTGSYTIVDSRGAESSATIRITVDPDAELQPPVAVDDLVSPWQVLQEADEDGRLKVDVLSNDIDPDGDITLATVTLPGATEDGPQVIDNMVQVTVTDRMQVIRYEVTDTDGQKAWATITVPGFADVSPVLDPNLAEQFVTAGEPKTFDLNELVQPRPGRTVRLVNDERVWGTHGETTATGPSTLTFLAPVDYVGPASMSFEVTDGKDGTDDEGRTAVLTVPITVLEAPATEQEKINEPPVTHPVNLTIAAGEAERGVDLSRAISDPDGDELTLSDLQISSSPGVTVTLDGDRLSGEAAPDAEVGAVLRGTITVSDGEFEVPLEVTVEVTASTRPLPTAVDDVVPEAVQGKTSVVDVLSNDVNPFDDIPLTVVMAVIETGNGTVEFTSDRVSITPAPDFVGTMVVRYTIEDATGQGSRSAEARIRLSVLGRPDVPGTPRMVSVGDREAVIDWTAPADNGAEITTYTVTAAGENGQSISQACETTTCTVTGLTNDVNYRFTVTATNRIGESDPSSPSAQIRPDVRPLAPTNPVATFGDQELELTWDAARTKGSAVNDYEIELSGPNGLVLRSVGPGTSYTWTGLTNGAAYTFRVRAKNDAPEPSDWSTPSRPEVPAGVPTPPRIVAAEDNQAPTGRQLRVVWNPPANMNGDKVSEYVIHANNTTVTVTPKGDGQLSRVFTVPSNTTYQVTITARNKAGVSDPSQSRGVIVYSAPGKPTGVKLTTPNPDAKAVATATFPGTGGQSAPRHEYQVNGAGTIRTFPSGGTSVSGTAGGKYTIRVRSCRDDGAGDKCSDWTSSNQVTVWTKPAKPTVTAGGSGTSKSISWSVPSSSNGRAIELVQISTNGGSSWSTADRTGTKKISGYGTTLTLQVRARNSEGVWSAVGSATVQNDPKPSPKVVVKPGDPVKPEEITVGSCGGVCPKIDITLSNFPPNTNISCTPWSRQPGYDPYKHYTITIRTDGNGDGHQEGPAFTGRGGSAWAVCDGVKAAEVPF